MTTFVNKYKRPETKIPRDLNLHTPVEELDLNYVFEVKTLRSDRVEMRPYVPSLHASLHFEGYQANPEILRYLGTPPWRELNDVLEWYERICRAPSDALFYAIYTDEPGADTPPTDPKDYVFAGVMGLISSSEEKMISEPGWIQILPPFQRTHVLTHAAGLAMHRILDHPDQGGLGLRRCQWQTTSINLKSQAAAKRLGYKPEGLLRAFQVLPAGKEGARPGRQGVRNADCMVRDNWYASVTWDEWEEGVRDHIDQLMARR